MSGTVATKPARARTADNDRPRPRSRDYPDLLCYPHTDLGNAERLTAMFGHEIRYCPPMKKWLIWDHRLWKVDSDGAINRKAKATVRQFGAQAADIEDREDRDKAEGFAKSSESAGAIRAMLECARNEEGISISAARLDTNLWLLNCLNGTVDLRTGDLREHRHEDLITKICPVKYDSAAECPRFEKFLRRIFDENEEVISFIQRAFGYALTGVVTEKAIFCFFGLGNNGKTTLLEVFRYVLGEYSGQLMIDSLIRRGPRQGANSNALADLSDLRGARFVTTSEAEEGAKLIEGQIKQLTGMGQVKACRKYENPITFQPTFKIFIDANHRPVVTGTDKAIWNRLKPVPFTITIRDDEMDKSLIETLKGEAAGILAWAVIGCLVWQSEGTLGSPPEVEHAVGEWRSESDPLQGFIERCCSLTTDSLCPAAELIAAYKEWSDGEETVLTSNQFSNRLRQLGCAPDRKKIKGKQVRIWRGIQLRKERG